MGNNLIFEIGTEELPFSCIKEGTSGLKTILADKLNENRLEFSSIKTFSSPRRLAALVEDLSATQKSGEKIVTGPPAGIAFNKEGNPTEAARGFAKSLNLKVSELEKIEVEGRGLYLGKKITEAGKKTEDVLSGILKDSILSLNFSKQMTWADYDISFIRPIRWILALYGNKVINFSIVDLNSGNVTYGHRTIGSSPIIIEDSENYFKLLEDRGRVIAEGKKRKKLILDQIKHLEDKVWNNKFRVVLNKDLLEEVVNLVEIPNVIAASFPDKFLYIPKELLIEAIQHHQKYFAVLGESGDVSTHFIIVQNGVRDEKGSVKKGNERVLRARLSDAAYFYEADRKHDFDYWTNKLKGVIFFSGVGSMYSKAGRLEKISNYIAGLLKEGTDDRKSRDKNLQENLSRASMLCKCDLVTNMVVEFPTLQGAVGRQYARERGENDAVSAAVFEHYLPRFAGDVLPSEDTGLILSIADKIDTITGMFAAGKIPTGSEDPFALRRKASGIVLSVLKGRYDFNLDGLIDYSMKLFEGCPGLKDRGKTGVPEEIRDFIITRFRFMLEKEGRRLDILDSILGSGCNSILDISLRYDALEEFISNKDIKRISLPMIRCKNIIGKREFGKVNSGLLIEECEKELYLSAGKKENLIKKFTCTKDYKAVLKELHEFGDLVDTFFDRVLVMDKDIKVRSNRINLIKQIMDLYLMFADFSALVVNNG